MSKRKDITGEIFNDVLVLEFIGQENTHAKYKCLCMLCGKIFNVTYSNLISGNTKSCSSCGKKSLSNGKEQDIFIKFKQGAKISHLAKEYNVDRRVIYRIIRDFTTDNSTPSNHPNCRDLFKKVEHQLSMNESQL